MASRNVQLVAISLLIAGTSAARVTSSSRGTDCEGSVPGSEIRSCANRMYMFNTCSGGKACKCPKYAQVGGDAAVCKENKEFKDGRKFNPTLLQGQGCRCITPAWVPTERKIIRYDCPTDTYFGPDSDKPDLPDFATKAQEWCNADLVPEDKRIPAALRGLYWMKDSPIEVEVAMCTSRAEYDPETRTARLSPWTDFVWRKKDHQKIPAGLIGTHMKDGQTMTQIYTLTFSDDSLTHANITMNAPVVNHLINFPLNMIDRTPDGTVQAAIPGDLFERPSSALGKKLGLYFAVRIVDDKGTINQDWYNMMKEAEGSNGLAWTKESGEWLQEKRGPASFQYFDQDCENPIDLTDYKDPEGSQGH